VCAEEEKRPNTALSVSWLLQPLLLLLLLFMMMIHKINV
jgi:hypothetical protein